MLKKRLPWQEELAIIDRTMRAISGISDPEEFVGAYYDGIGELVAVEGYVAVSRRNVEAPYYLITRSSRFTEDINPWTQRDRLPKCTGGLLGEIAYGDKPVLITDLPDRLSPDDPGYFYLQGFQTLIGLPHYDAGEAVNFTMMLIGPGAEIDPSFIPILHWQSGLFGRGTQNLVLRNQLSKALATLDEELQTVGSIQRSLLPQTLPAIDGFEFAAYYRTSARAGGDYYDFFKLDGGGWGLFIADVAGHGTPAAVLMAITHAIAHASPTSHTPPGALLENLNDRLSHSYTHGGTFITAFYAVLDPVSRRLTYSTAGHNPPRLVRNHRVMSLDEKGALPLGIFDGQHYAQTTITLEKGDILLLYTDGITEAMAPLRGATSRELFGTQRLDDLLLSCHGCSSKECIEKIQQEVATFTENRPPSDDQTLIAIRCLP